MYCSKCGKEIHNDAKFCIYCGNKIKKNTPDHSKYERFDYAPVVLRAEQGDEEAFTILWAKTNQPYRYYIYLQSKNKDAVDDILQESYRRIFKDIMEKKLQNPEAFFSWGKRIVLNTTADHYRKYKYETQEEKVSESTDDENDVKDFYKEDYATDFNPEAQITQNEVSDILQDIIGELPESQKNCILLWMDEYKTDEIAEILGMSSGTVKSNVNYAKKKIKTKVEDLEKQGVKLYSMAPFTFFVWIMAQFDQNAASAAPSMGNTVLFEQIMKQVHTIATTASVGSISGQVGNKLNETTSQSLEAAKQAVSQNSGQTASSTSDVRTQPAGQMQNNSVNNEAFSHAEKASNMAQSTAGNTIKKSFISTVAGKVLIGVASILIIAGVGFGITHHQTDTKKAASVATEKNLNKSDEKKDNSESKKDTTVDYEQLNKNELGLTLEDLKSAKDAPLGVDLKGNGLVRVARDDKDKIYLYQYNKSVVNDKTGNTMDVHYKILQVGNIFQVGQSTGYDSVQYAGDIINEYGKIYYEDFDNDGQKEIAYVTNDKSGQYDLSNEAYDKYGYADYSFYYNGDDTFTIPEDNVYVDSCALLTIIKGNFFVDESPKWMYRDLNLLKIDTGIYSTALQNVTIENGVVTFKILGTTFEVPYIPSVKQNGYNLDYTNLSWYYILTEKYRGLEYKISGNKITLDFPFMIQDGTGLFFNEDYACYYGLGTCNVIYNGGASDNFHFENVSFTELEK